MCGSPREDDVALTALVVPTQALLLLAATPRLSRGGGIRGWRTRVSRVHLVALGGRGIRLAHLVALIGRIVRALACHEWHG